MEWFPFNYTIRLKIQTQVQVINIGQNGMNLETHGYVKIWIGLTYEIDGKQHNVLERGLLLLDDWDGDKYYWDNENTNWVKY